MYKGMRERERESDRGGERERERVETQKENREKKGERKRQKDKEQERERERDCTVANTLRYRFNLCMQIITYSNCFNFFHNFDANGRSRTEYYCYRAL